MPSTESSNKLASESLPTQEGRKKISKGALLTIFISMNFIWSGDMLFFDFPQLFEGILIGEFDISAFDVSMLYTSCSILSIITTPLGSYFCQKVGLGKGMLILHAFTFFGVVICFFAVKRQQFILMIIGRTVYGIGEEIICATQVTVAEKWFAGKNLSLAVSINRFFVFLAMSSAAYFAPDLFLRFRTMELPLFLYAVGCALSFFSNLVYFIEEQKNEKYLAGSDQEEEYMKYKMKISDLKRIGPLGYMTLITLFFFPVTYYSFTNVGTDCLVQRFGFTYEDAKDRMSLLPLLGMLLTPTFSALIVKTGKKGIALIVAAVLILGTFITFYYLPYDAGNTIYFGIVGLGVYYGLYNSVVWSILALSVPKQAVNIVVGTGVGLMNLAFAVFPLYFGTITKPRDRNAYQLALISMMVMAVICLIIGIVTTIIDFKIGKLLHCPENRKEVQNLRDEMSQDFRNRCLTMHSVGTKLSKYNSLAQSEMKGGNKFATNLVEEQD